MSENRNARSGPGGGVIHQIWCLADSRGQVWKHSHQDTLRRWVDKRNELLATIRAIPAKPFRAPEPGFGVRVPDDASADPGLSAKEVRLKYGDLR
jgi:hypothetical protein